ncbi:MAG: TIGR03936 family radical SAM-associated protein, partial [Syntrophorhabdaceae bacterium]|nr:TIGR03936 family radical SAM-associated protein [Syntrophorhabdaceae bacterium]
CPPGVSNITRNDRIDAFPTFATSDIPVSPNASFRRHVVRIAYAKEGPAKYLSGLEVQSLWGRSLRRAELPVAYSQGFNPSPRISLSPALPVGTDSACEFLEAEFNLPVPPSTLSQALAPHLPAGMRVLDAKAVPPGAPRLSDFEIISSYSVRPVSACAFPEGITPESAAELFAAFRAAERFPLTLVRESQATEVDIRPLVCDLRVNDGAIFIKIIQGAGKGVRPPEAVSAILGVAMLPETLIIRKESAELALRRPK